MLSLKALTLFQYQTLQTYQATEKSLGKIERPLPEGERAFEAVEQAPVNQNDQNENLAAIYDQPFLWRTATNRNDGDTS